jgi:hypothetical protein
MPSTVARQSNDLVTRRAIIDQKRASRRETDICVVAKSKVQKRGSGKNGNPRQQLSARVVRLPKKRLARSSQDVNALGSGAHILASPQTVTDHTERADAGDRHTRGLGDNRGAR